MRSGLRKVARNGVMGILITATLGVVSAQETGYQRRFSAGSSRARVEYIRANRSAEVEDRSSDSDSATDQNASSDRTTSQGSTAEPPKLKNYYRQLFGTERPSGTPSASAADRIGNRYPSGQARAIGPTRTAAADSEDNATELIHADYRQSSEQSDQKLIEQVHSSSNAPPFPENMETAPAVPIESDSSASESNESTESSDELHPFGDSRSDATTELVSAGPQTASVSLKWVKKSVINVGQPGQVALIVKNTGTADAANVSVKSYFPNSVRLTDAQPKPARMSDHLVWEFATIPSGEEKTILIDLIPSEQGELKTKAYVQFITGSAETFTVDEPKLKLAMRGPSDVTVGDPASQTIVVSNPGTGTASNISITAMIPDGLEHARGSRLVMEIGSLNPGESRTVRLALAAIRGGAQTIQVQAKADAGLQSTTKTDVNVVAASLNVVMEGPGLRYVGRTGEYTVKVSNEGLAESSNVRVLYRIPKGFQFVKTEQGGQYDADTNTVNWFVGQLGPKETRELSVKLSAETIGDYTHYAGVVSEHGNQSQAQCRTKVDGTASLVMEIVDLDDPVEVGVETAYEIRVSNDGSKAAQNVQVGCELPPGVELVKAEGPGSVKSTGSDIQFQSLSTIEPGKTVLYRVHVRGAVDGNHRFRVRLNSDSITQPFTVDELTRFYGE